MGGSLGGFSAAPIHASYRFASELDCDTRVERRAREFATEAVESGLASGRNPSGVAAACLYTAARVVEDADRVTQADAAAVADVTPVTVRSTYQALSE
jgi:transcription initiation factor TFIIB